jgi:hypothetical protein
VNIMIPRMRKKAMKNSVSKVPKSNMTHARQIDNGLNRVFKHNQSLPLPPFNIPQILESKYAV